MSDKNSNSVLTGILAVLLAGTVVLSGVMATTVTKITRQSTIESTQTIAQSQLSAIEEFVKKQEDRLLDYSRAAEVKNLLKVSNALDAATEDQKAELEQEFNTAQAGVQKYMEEISITPDEGGSDEGIYVSTWKTKVLAHTNAGTVGISTRKDGSDALAALQNSLLEAGDNAVYNTGIILSPVGDHSQIVSLYKGVFDENGAPIGLVGMGVYTEELEKALGFEITGMPSAKFSMVNVQDAKYIFKEGDTIKEIIYAEDGTESHVYKTTDNNTLIQLCKDYNNANAPEKVGQYEFENSVAVYAYSDRYGWIFQIEDVKSEMYAAESRVRTFMYVFLAAIAVIAVIIFLLNRKMLKTSAQLIRTIEKQEKTRKALNDSMDRDVLTQSKSRLAFIENFSQTKEGKAKPTYFILHSFNGLANMNMNLGIDATDNFIMDFAQALFAAYGKENVYRTSNKEFVCVKMDDTMTPQEILTTVRTLHGKLCAPMKAADGTNMVPSVDTSIIKQTRANNLNVLPILKEVARERRPVTSVNIPFVDLDKQ